MNVMERIPTWTLFALLLLAGVAKAQVSASGDALEAYTGCSFNDGLSVVEITPLADGVTARTVPTVKGPRTVTILEGKRVMFGYPGEDFYANVKVEILAAKDYSESKATLIDSFDYILASGDNLRNYGLKSPLNGFDIRGLDRSKREGGVLGIYLLFDDATRIVTTIYFLNQEPPTRFKTMAEYGALRDRFLGRYTQCIRTGVVGLH